MDDLLYWVNERDRMRVRKREGVLPYSKDPIMAGTRWCNVRREDDRVTIWIHNNWLTQKTDPHVMSFAMCVARMVNWPDTLDELGFPFEWNPYKFREVLAARKLRGDKVWTSAYMITGGYSEGGYSKETIIARVLNGAYERLCYPNSPNRILPGDTLESAWTKIQTPGIGSFLAAQVVADLKHTQPLAQAKDWDYWCAVGPGSTKGLNFLHDRPQERTINQKDFVREVNEVGTLLRHAGFALDAQNVQNCLCEFHKYVKIKYYNGRAKSRYTPNGIRSYST
jgi:hypothetical protein